MPDSRIDDPMQIAIGSAAPGSLRARATGGSGIDDCLIDLRVFHAKCFASDARLPGGD
jgi:hypothetical protein